MERQAAVRVNAVLARPRIRLGYLGRRLRPLRRSFLMCVSLATRASAAAKRWRLSAHVFSACASTAGVGGEDAEGLCLGEVDGDDKGICQLKEDDQFEERSTHLTQMWDSRGQCLLWCGGLFWSAPQHGDQAFRSYKCVPNIRECVHEECLALSLHRMKF